MRQIKLRQWLGPEGWHYWGTGPHSDGATWKGPAISVSGYPEESFLWTGLVDKNSALVYEGDIVTAFEKNRPGNQIRGIVGYDPCDAEWLVETDDPSWPFASVVVLLSFEVIGNIIENVELKKEILASAGNR